jgi:probable FeS assembly SUF system protein SufT
MIGERQKVTVTRDVPVIQIPSGEASTVKAGAEVVLMQSLGGTYTIYTPDGDMVRVDGRDADALGMKVTRVASTEVPQNAPDVEEAIWELLRTVYDPEIPVNIVDLGLIYLCEASPLPEPQTYRVDIRMTLTAPGCGMGAVLKSDVERKAAEVPGVKEINVDLVFDPPWDQTMMTEAARLELGF